MSHLGRHCHIPDLDQDGKPLGMRHYEPLEEGEYCPVHFIPWGYKVPATLYFMYATTNNQILIFLGIESVWLFVYKSGWFEQYKIEKDRKWPWEQDKEKWNKLLLRSICLNIFNMTVMNGLIDTSILAYIYDYQLPFIQDFTAEGVPNGWTMFKQFSICIICEDFCFYWGHRLLHCKDKRLPLYKWIHKVHHEFEDNVSIGSMHAHPVEFAISNHLPYISGVLLLGRRMHFSTYLFWTIFRMAESADAHSGYEFPWSIFRLMPFSADSTFHDFHHTRNVGNYGTFTWVWDSLFDTSLDYYVQYPEGSKY